MAAETTGSTVELLVALKAAAPFVSLPPEDVALLVERAAARAFEPGDVVIARGTAVESVHLVVDGSLVEERAGRPWAVREPYEIVGGVDALAASGTDVEVRARTAARTLELERETLLEVCYDRFDVLNAIASGVAAMAIAARLRLGAGGFAGSCAPAGDRPPRGLNLAERVGFMRSMPVLRDVAMLTLAEAAARSAQATVEAGETLWRTGDRADHFLLVVSGVLDCAAGDGLRFTLGAGGAAGVLDAIAMVPRWYDASVRTRLVVLRIPRAELMDLLEDDPATAVAGLTELARGTSDLVAAVPAAT